MHLLQAVALAGVEGVALRALFPLVKSDAKTTWIHVGPTGEWKGHDNGPFELTAAKFDTIVQNFESKVNPTPLDYEHASLLAQEAPAAGWVHKLQRRGEDLFAFVEFTEKAARQIAAGEYRYCSAVFVWNAKHPQTGERIGPSIHSIALTNVPFIDGQQPIALTATGTTRLRMDPEKQLEQIQKVLDIDDPARLQAALEALVALVQAKTGKAPKKEGEGDKGAPAPPPAPAADKPKAGEEKKTPASDKPATPAAAGAPADAARAAAGDELLSLLMEATGADVAGTVTWVRERLDAIKGLGAAGSPTGASSKPEDAAALSRKLKIADGEVTRLSARIAELEKGTGDTKKATAAARIEEALKAGRILDAEKDDFTWLSQSDPERFERMLAARGGKVPVAEHSAPPAPGKTPGKRLDLSEAEEHALTLYKASGGTGEESFLARYRARKSKSTAG